MKVENPQLGKHYLLYREGTFLKEVHLVGMDNLYYCVLPSDDDFDEEAYFDTSIPLNYAKTKYYLTECNHSKNKEDKLEPTAQETQATKLQLFTEDFLRKSREVKEMAAELKKYLDEQTETHPRYDRTRIEGVWWKLELRRSYHRMERRPLLEWQVLQVKNLYSV